MLQLRLLRGVFKKQRAAFGRNEARTTGILPVPRARPGRPWHKQRAAEGSPQRNKAHFIASFSPLTLLRPQFPQNGIEEKTIRQRAFHMAAAIDNSSGNGEDAESLRQIRELGSFNAVGAHQVTFHGKLIRQAHGRRAVGSGGGGENLQVKGLTDPGEFFAAFRKQSRVALRSSQNAINQN